uniref:Gamma-aminobutyric acid receptor subunit beta n=1 Tax=Ascaris lumbricoides TaxID=6252 RepID=A0A9J2P0S3_ASCLU
MLKKADDIPDTTEISNILDRLTDNSTYDKRLRPKYGADPVDVGITIHVSSISAVSEVDMDFTLDFYLRQTWHDPRLAFRHQSETHADNIEALTVGVDYLEKLWKPDTFFPNEKKSYFHKATTHNSFLRIDPDGNVYTSQRLTVTATCHMKLHLFPMDSQKCKLEIESYGHSILDIIYFFNKSKESISRSEFELPQFVLADVQFTSTVQKQSSGDYSRLVCVFLFKRNIGFYIIQIYLPSILIVVISWVSFWLSRDATPARVALGVLTVLTMTTLTTTTNASMPKVSYVKSIDIFLGVSFVMVFSALLEYAAVGYISKRMQLVVKKKRTRSIISFPFHQPAVSLSHLPNSSSVAFSAPSGSQTPLPTFADHLYQPFYSSKDKRSNLYNGDLLNPPVLLKEGECQCPIPPSSSSLPIRTIMIPDKEEALINCCCAGKLRPSEIDKYSRSVFPLVSF